MKIHTSADASWLVGGAARKLALVGPRKWWTPRLLGGLKTESLDHASAHTCCGDVFDAVRGNRSPGEWLSPVLDATFDCYAPVEEPYWPNSDLDLFVSAGFTRGVSS